MAILQPLVTELHFFDVTRYGIADAKGGKGQWEPHLHSFHQLDATLAGSCWQAINDRQRIDATPGTAILIPPMVRHGHRTESWFEVGMFKFSLAPAAWAQLGARPLRFDLSASTLAKVREAGTARAAKAAWQEHQTVAALTDCLVEALRAVQAASAGGTDTPAATAADPFQRELGRVLEAIEQAPYNGWTVANLAERCHLSADHFTKRFRTALAMKPQEYLLRTRIRAAARSLHSDVKLSIKAVAEAAGYATVHSFSRAFRQVTGSTPARFRHHPGDL